MTLRDDIINLLDETDRSLLVLSSGRFSLGVTAEMADRILDLIRSRRDDIADALMKPYEHQLSLYHLADAVIELLCGEDADEQQATEPHMCGLTGFDPMQGDRCPACDRGGHR
jgi:hypothetical protein